jgi:serine/threonine protein kinase
MQDRAQEGTLAADFDHDGNVQLTQHQRATGDASALLKRVYLDPEDVVMTVRIGAGAFGEVLKGACLGQQVAVKTMLGGVTEANAKAFRAEILLTATLQHPNIVNFVGACWSQELMCLVLEYVPKGSLDGLLKDPSLTWADPLLRLATDIARGMAYLHGCSFFDEQDGQHKQCILHRDLKVCASFECECSYLVRSSALKMYVRFCQHTCFDLS